MRIHRALCAYLLGAAAFYGAGATAAPVEYRTPNVITTPGATQVVVNGQTFVNLGLQGMARLPSSTRDFNGDTFGAFSGMDILPGTWRRNADGSYEGTLYALPDRGPNGVGDVEFSDFPARVSTFALKFTPYTAAANLPASPDSQHQIALTQAGGLLFKDFAGQVTTGLDAAGTVTQKGYVLPTPLKGGRISFDTEGLRILKDGGFYVSDEYGPNVYLFDPRGVLQGAILPPPALVPRDAKGKVVFTSKAGAVSGRRGNQGLEGLALTPDGMRLASLLQSAALQDSTAAQRTRLNTRLMIYDISKTRTPMAPVEDYILQLPIYTSAGDGSAPNRTAAQSEMLALNSHQFLVLARDGNGLGTNTLNPVFKSILLVDTAGATNVAGTAYETTATPVAPGGVLDAAITPVRWVELVNLLNTAQLGKFGENLHNTAPDRLTLGEKWEALALAPVLDASAPDDYFLFVGNDNDFLSSTCTVGGQDCSQKVDSDATLLAYRLTLPTYGRP